MEGQVEMFAFLYQAVDGNEWSISVPAALSFDAIFPVGLSVGLGNLSWRCVHFPLFSGVKSQSIWSHQFPNRTILGKNILLCTLSNLY
jgi:hypothetical protein